MHRRYGTNYSEPAREVVCDTPYGGSSAYEADYRVDEYGNRIYHRRNALGNEVTEVVSTVVPSGHHHHQHQNHHYGRPAQYIERRDGCVVDNAYDPYRRIY